MEGSRVVEFFTSADVNHRWKLELIPNVLQHGFKTFSKLEHEMGPDEAFREYINGMLIDSECLTQCID